MQTIFVITVCRNAASLLEETIQSVLSQTYQNIKYIIIDGASTDGTVDIIKKYEDRLALWISEPDKGIYDAMNKGLAKARELGSDGWVNFMNAGDIYISNEIVDSIFSKEKYESNKISMISEKEFNPDDESSSFQSYFVRIGDWKYDIKYKIAAVYKVMYNLYHNSGKDSIKSINSPIINNKDYFSTIDIKSAKGEFLAVQSIHRSWRWWKEYIKWRCF